MRQTQMIRKEDLVRDWILIDAAGMVLGRLASKISLLLQGKNKVWYTPHLDCGDNIVVVNVAKIILTGTKWKNKIYYSHSNYPGGLKKHSALDLFKKSPSLLMQKAVQRMLPRTRLKADQMHRLFLYQSLNHSHQGQKPKLLKLF